MNIPSPKCYCIPFLDLEKERRGNKREEIRDNRVRNY